MVAKMVKRVLESFKNLSGKQADALIEIIKKQKSLTKKEIDTLLNNEGICEGNSSYKIVDQLVSRGVLFLGSDGRYSPINISMLISECNQSLGKFEAEIGGLEISRNWEESDPRKRSQQIDDEHKIINELYKLKNDGFDLVALYKDKDNKMSFWKNVKAHLKIKPTKGIYNCIIFCNKDKTQNSGAIILSKRLEKSGKDVYFGSMIMDLELFKLFKRGVANEKR